MLTAHVDIASKNGNIEDCRIDYTLTHPIALTFCSKRFGNIYIEADDLFEALTKVRLHLEKEGYLILVNGARKDAAVSGMLRQMGLASKVYLLTIGKKATMKDTVPIFGPSPLDTVGTIAEQQAYYDVCLRANKNSE